MATLPFLAYGVGLSAGRARGVQRPLIGYRVRASHLNRPQGEIGQTPPRGSVHTSLGVGSMRMKREWYPLPNGWVPISLSPARLAAARQQIPGHFQQSSRFSVYFDLAHQRLEPVARLTGPAVDPEFR